MTSASNNHRHCTQEGNTLLVVLLTIAILAAVAGNLMWSASARYHVTYQSASWQESLVAAEAGVDFGMSELRQQVINGKGAAFPAPTPGSAVGWTKTRQNPAGVYPDAGCAFPADGGSFVVGIHGGEGNTQLSTRVYVDVPGSDAGGNFAQTIPANISQFICEQSDKAGSASANHFWYRIRSLGQAGVSGPPRPSPDSRDNWLRRFSFVTDWRTARPVGNAGPQVSRLLEVVAKPLTNFRNALMSDRQHDNIAFAMNLNGLDVLVDSYDSSKGPYDTNTNHGEQGNLATNGTVINAGLATVKGDAMTNQGSTINANNVSGQRRDDFYQELTPITAADMSPGWQGQVNLGTLTNPVVPIIASTSRDNPTLVHLNGIDLKGAKVLQIVPPPNPDPTAPSSTPVTSYVKIYVEGDVRIANDGSAIELGNGVIAIIYFTGNVDLRGYGILNDSFTSSHLLLEGIQPAADANGNVPLRNINLSTTQDFEGILYAPSHDLTLALQSTASTVVKGLGAGVIPPPKPDQSKAISDLKDQLNRDQDKINKALSDQSAAYSTWTNNPTDSNWANYQQKGKDLIQAQTNLSGDQAKLDNLLQGTLAQQDDHARGYNGIYGSFVARTINVQSKTHLHYDEALREAGPVNHYEIVNWFEDNSSRATVNW